MIGDALALEREAIEASVEGRTLVDVLLRNAASFPESPAVAWRSEGAWRRLTWSEYRQQVLVVAAGLMDLGVEAGERVAIMAANRPEHVLADLGAIHAGATPVTVYSTLAPRQLAYVADHGRMAVAVIEAASLDRWRDVWDQIDSLRHIVVLDAPDGFDPGDDRIVTWNSMLDRARLRGARLVEERALRTTPDSTATLIYTSGTTGEPKGVVITHRNVLWTLATMAQAVDLPNQPRLVSYLPLAHIAERVATHYLGMWTAGEVTYCANVAAVMSVVRETKPHLFVGVPRIWEQVHKRLTVRLDGEENERRAQITARAITRGREAVDGTLTRAGRAEWIALDRIVLRKIREELGLNDVVIAVTTAGPIDSEIIRFFRGLGIPLHELYGMTESSGPATTNVPGFDRIGSVGRSFSGVEVATRPDGELVIRGGNVAAGYEADPEGTAATFTEDGWLLTGDLAEIDADGFVTIVGRKKDIIVNAAGKNIAPVPIELSLKRHDIIAEACVIGDRRPNLVALVVIDREAAQMVTRDLEGDEGDDAIRAAVQAAVDMTNNNVSKVERIHRFAVVDDDWTPDNGLLTPSLKLRRAAVMERYQDLLAEL